MLHQSKCTVGVKLVMQNTGNKQEQFLCISTSQKYPYNLNVIHEHTHLQTHTSKPDI